MTDKEKELFLNALESLGYRGFDGKRYHTEDTSYPSPDKILRVLLAQDYPDEIPAEIKYKLVTIKAEKKYQALYPILRELQVEVAGAKPPESQTTGEDFLELYSRVTPYFDVGAKSASIVDCIHLIDETNEMLVTEITAKAYLLVKGLKPEQIAANPKYHLMFVYEFKNTGFIYKKEYAGQLLTCINLCPRPYWLKLVVVPGIDSSINRFLNHLFPGEKSREFVLDWLYWAITDRADTVLVLTGKKGIGKDIFLNLVAALIGPEQVEKLTQAFFEDKFTGSMYQKRLLHADEISLVTTEAKNKLKRILNPLVSIENKGQDAKTRVNSASLAITCNDTDLLGVEPDDRRYSIPEITDIPLKQAMDEADIKDLAEGLLHLQGEYKDIVARFGHFILNRTPKYSRTDPYKEEYFYKITLDSLSNWKKEIFDYLVINYKGDGEPFKLSLAVRSGLKGVQRKAVTSFLESFHFMNKYKMGTAVYSDDDKTKDVYIEPNMKFVNYVRTLDLEKLGIKKVKAGTTRKKTIEAQTYQDDEPSAEDLL
jgi:Family of unknown function (DUF5906)